MPLVERNHFPGRPGRRGVTCYVQTDASRGLESEYRGDLRRGRAQGLPGGASTAAPVHLRGAAQGVGVALDSFLVCFEATRRRPPQVRRQDRRQPEGRDVLRPNCPRPSAAFVCLENSPWSGGGAGGVPGVRSFSKRVRRHRRERAGGFVVHEPTSLAHFRQMLVLAAVDHRGASGGTAAEGAPWALPHPLVASTHQSAPVLHPATAVGRPVGRTAFGAEGCPGRPR